MSEEIKQIALVGQPNSGKTTLFNWFTGFKNRTVNYPGSTIFISSGNLSKKYQTKDHSSIVLTDTPGCYSLNPKSMDEEVTRHYLFNEKNLRAVICVIDGSKLQAQLPLFFQLKEAGFKIVLALNMWDLIAKQNLNLKKLELELGVPVVPVNGLLGAGVYDVISHVLKILKSTPNIVQKVEPWPLEKITEASKKSQLIYSSISNKSQDRNLFISKKFDQFLLSPKFGLGFFAIIMFGLFSSIFWLADPFMGYVDNFFSFLIETTNAFGSNSLAVDFISNGIFASFGAVLVFVPQIFILFLGISLLEDSGYLARAVSLLDGPFSKIGLTGRSFIPFLSGYACAIPAILAARNLSSQREKLMVFFSVPFMSCSARLPVYALLLSALFYGQAAWKPGLALSFIYVGSFLLGVISVALLNLVIKQKKQRPFVIDIPIYRRPSIVKSLHSAWIRTKHYIFKAGPAIFVVSLIIWVMVSFPRDLNLSEANQIQASYAGQLGKLIEPVFEFIGVDWRVGVGLIAAFAAREVFVSALILVFNITGDSEETMTNSLLENMNSAVNSSGELVFSIPSILALIVFFMIALQCVTTTAIVYKESKSFKLAAIQLVSFNVLAYIFAAITYHSFNFIL